MYNISNWLIFTVLGGILIIPIILFTVLFVAFALAGQWKLFIKAGKEGFKNIIPFSDYSHGQARGVLTTKFSL